MNSELEIDQNLLNKMFMRIRTAEANNLKMAENKLNDQQMVNKIVEIIQTVLKEANNEVPEN